jgi:hypothetical protein
VDFLYICLGDSVCKSLYKLQNSIAKGAHLSGCHICYNSPRLYETWKIVTWDVHVYSLQCDGQRSGMRYDPGIWCNKNLMFPHEHIWSICLLKWAIFSDCLWHSIRNAYLGNNAYLKTLYTRLHLGVFACSTKQPVFACLVWIASYLFWNSPLSHTRSLFELFNATKLVTRKTHKLSKQPI